MDIAELKRFRNEHYFETHGEEFLDKEVKEHPCIHQFQLDNGFLPVPLNPNVYGRSR